MKHKCRECLRLLFGERGLMMTGRGLYTLPALSPLVTRGVIGIHTQEIDGSSTPFTLQFVRFERSWAVPMLRNSSSRQA